LPRQKLNSSIDFILLLGYNASMENLFTKLDAIIILHPSNLFYFTGYSNEDASVVLTKEKKYYICDKRTSEEAGELLKDFEIVDIDKLGYATTAKNLVKKLGCKKVGYEDWSISHRHFIEISCNGIFKSYKLYPASQLISDLRTVKKDYELELMKKAQAITDKVFLDTLNYIKPGMTELEVASFMNSKTYAYGAELAFPPIVAFGKNTSKPHAHPGNNVLNQNDVVTLDFGAKYNGYCSDMTRSFVVGEAPDGYVEVYNAVLEAQETAIKNLRAGITGKEGDAIARNVLKEKGYGEYFTHSLGHSLGIDVHEGPGMTPRCNEILPVGSVLSVEPGVYIEGKYGVRIEDIVLFQKSGVDNLTNSNKNLIILK